MIVDRMRHQQMTLNKAPMACRSAYANNWNQGRNLVGNQVAIHIPQARDPTLQGVLEALD
jgi:hypothetical protein